MTATDTSLTTLDYDAVMGTLVLVGSPVGLRAILWPNDNDERGRVKLGERSAGSSKVLDTVARQLDEYFGGARRDFDLPLDPHGTEFQVKTWLGLAAIPYGTTTSYGEQAASLGNPKAVRAVASANGRNPISIVLPCHRIIGADGSLTGFAGGLEWKRWLLDHEASHVGQQKLL